MGSQYLIYTLSSKIPDVYFRDFGASRSDKLQFKQELLQYHPEVKFHQSVPVSSSGKKLGMAGKEITQRVSQKASSPTQKKASAHDVSELRARRPKKKGRKFQPVISSGGSFPTPIIKKIKKETSEKTLDDVKLEAIKKMLKVTKGNRRETAKRLRIGERTLYRKIKKHGL